MRFCYAACRADADAPKGPGIAGAPIELLVDGPVAVITSPIPQGVEPGDAASLAAHARVVQEAFQTGAVIPFRFPTVTPSDDDTVTQLVRPLKETLLRGLDHLAGREEVRLRLVYDEDVAVAEVLAANPRLARLRGKPDFALQLGEAIAAELRQRSEADAHAALEVLRPLVDEVKIDAIGGETTVLTASLLAERGATERVNEAAEQWAADRPPIQVRVVGPLPPYSFAGLEEQP